MNELEQLLMRVSEATLSAWAKVLDDEFGEDDMLVLGDTSQQIEVLMLVVEAITEKILREADVFPGLQTHNIRAWRDKKNGGIGYGAD